MKRRREEALKKKIMNSFFSDFKGKHADEIVNVGLNQGERRVLTANFYEHV